MSYQELTEIDWGVVLDCLESKLDEVEEDAHEFKDGAAEKIRTAINKIAYNEDPVRRSVIYKEPT